MGTKKTGLKEFIEKSPMIVLVTVAVAAGSTTAGVMSYFAAQKSDIEKVRVETEVKNEVLASKTEIAALKTKLASIERRVGSDERSFFDVTKLIVTPDSVKELDSRYRTMAGGAFFVAEPSTQKWHYSQTSELAIMKEMLGGDKDFKSLEELLGKKNVYMWRTADSFPLRPLVAKGKESAALPKLNYFPYVLVQVLSDRDIQGMATAVEKLFNKPTAKVDETLKALEATARDLKPAISKPAVNDGTGQVGKRADNAPDVEVSADAVAKAEETLTTLFRGDIVPFLMAGVIFQNVSIAESYSNVRVELKTAQRKGNVLYLETRIEFADVVVEGRDNLDRFVVDQEWFVVTSPSGIVVVKAQIPSSDGRGEMYSWVGEWLAGLRLPVIR